MTRYLAESSKVITLTVNGESCRTEGPLPLQAFLERWSAGARMVAVVNDEVIGRQKVGDVVLREGDRIELLSLAGGG